MQICYLIIKSLGIEYLPWPWAFLPLGTEKQKLSGCSRTTPHHDRNAAWQSHNDGTEEGAAPAYSRWGFTQRLIPARTSTPRTSFT